VALWLEKLRQLVISLLEAFFHFCQALLKKFALPAAAEVLRLAISRFSRST